MDAVAGNYADAPGVSVAHPRNLIVNAASNGEELTVAVGAVARGECRPFGILYGVASD
jgi:hypothetical protein